MIGHCVLCGQANLDGTLLCPAHISTDAAWAASNRAMCDLLHRGIAPPAASTEPDVATLAAEALELVADL